MIDTRSEIASLEEGLRLAELGPDPKFFEEILADQAVLMQDGQTFPKAKVVQAHQPGAGPKFTRVEMSDTNIIDYGVAAVVTCRGTYEGPGTSVTLKFTRVWLKTHDRWQIIAAAVST
jgi:uncharacterized protein DUF4440